MSVLDITNIEWKPAVESDEGDGDFELVPTQQSAQQPGESNSNSSGLLLAALELRLRSCEQEIVSLRTSLPSSKVVDSTSSLPLRSEGGSIVERKKIQESPSSVPAPVPAPISVEVESSSTTPATGTMPEVKKIATESHALELALAHMRLYELSQPVDRRDPLVRADEALRWLRLSASEGYAHAQWTLAQHCLFTDCAKAEALRLLSACSAQGHAMAALQLAIGHEKKSVFDLEPNYPEAMRFYRLAAEAQPKSTEPLYENHMIAVARAQFCLGWCYDMPDSDKYGIPGRDVKQAEFWYALARKHTNLPLRVHEAWNISVTDYKLSTPAFAK